MAMQMQRAFSSKMLTKMTRYSIGVGSYDDENVWVEGTVESSNIWAVMTSGNKLSQFEEGKALHSEDGGARFSDFKALFVTDKYPLDIKDKIGYKGTYYNILQESDEEVFGFRSFLIEKSQEWTP